MADSVLGQIVALKDMPSKKLRAVYKELFNGKKAPSNNRVYLWKKIAYRMQELKHGGVSKEAQAKAEEIMKERDPINNRPKEARKPKHNSRDKRLPIPGTVITKEYKGKTIEVKVLEKGFEFKGKTHRSLTAITRKITGTHWNGYLFFNL